MDMQKVLGSLQLPVAGIGALTFLGAGLQLTAVVEQDSTGEGFLTGLVVLALYIATIGGFVVLAGGLAIPPNGGWGVSFSRRQRMLFATAAIVAVGSILLPLGLLPLALPMEVLIQVWFGMTVMAGVAFSGGVGLWVAHRLVALAQAYV